MQRRACPSGRRAASPDRMIPRGRHDRRVGEPLAAPAVVSQDSAPRQTRAATASARQNRPLREERERQAATLRPRAGSPPSVPSSKTQNPKPKTEHRTPKTQHPTAIAGARRDPAGCPAGSLPYGSIGVRPEWGGRLLLLLALVLRLLFAFVIGVVAFFVGIGIVAAGVVIAFVAVILVDFAVLHQLFIGFRSPILVGLR